MYKDAKSLLADGKSWSEIKLLEMLITLDIAGDTAACNTSSYIRELFDYPRLCNVCKDCNQDDLAACPDCNSVFYCSSRHKDEDMEAHKLNCMNYSLLLECDRYERNNGGDMLDLPFPSNIDTKYVKLPDRMMTLLKVHFEIDQGRELTNPDPGLVTLITQRLSYPLSLLYALQDLSLGPHDQTIEEVEELRIHIVGAQSRVELLGIIKWEYFAHRLPKLRKLHITFVGNELLSCEKEYTEGEDHIVDDSAFTLCEQCKADRVIVYELVNKLYQDYTQQDYYQTPHAVIAFNCGFHEVGSHWQESFKHLVGKSSAPLIFTSYTESEASRDLEVLSSAVAVDIIRESHLNPYRSVRPYRDPEVSSVPLYFWNNYITIVRGVDE